MRQDWFVAAVLGVSLMAMGQTTPKVVNAQYHTEPAGAGLSATVDRFQHQSGPQWLGYEVAAVPRSRFTVCSGDSGGSMDDGCCGVYRLENEDNTFRNSDDGTATQTSVDVLVRIDQAIAAIAAHETAKATAALVGFASAPSELWLREKAAFWLGAGRGHDGLLALEKLASDSDPEFRKKLTFDFSVNRDPAAVDDLIKMAKSDSDTQVREQAIFWVGQKASKKAVALLKDMVVNDPEEAVKKKAVFAISQLPKDEAVPELLHVAQTNPDPAVRKDAMFWLGQTHDPRALAYFEQILAK